LQKKEKDFQKKIDEWQKEATGIPDDDTEPNQDEELEKQKEKEKVQKELAEIQKKIAGMKNPDAKNKAQKMLDNLGEKLKHATELGVDELKQMKELTEESSANKIRTLVLLPMALLWLSMQ